MKALKKTLPDPSTAIYHSDDESKPRKSSKKHSEIRSNSSSSNEIVFLGDFPAENVPAQAFSYREDVKAPIESKEKEEDKQFSIKLSEGFTFVDSFDYKQFQAQEIFQRLCPPEKYRNNQKCNICLADFNFLVNRKKIWFLFPENREF